VFEHFVLRGIRVLVFIDQHMAHGRLPALTHFGILCQQLQRQTDQVIEVHALVSRQAFFVAPHDARSNALVFVLRNAFSLCAGQPCIFPSTDGPLPLLCRVGIGGAAAVLKDAHHIV
jgi:hypothetical protein